MKGQSPIVEFALLVLITSIVATTFYLFYWSAPEQAARTLKLKQHENVQTISSMLLLYAPAVVGVGKPYRATVYNIGASPIPHPRALLVKTNGTTYSFSLYDDNGKEVASLLPNTVAFVEISPLPEEGDTLIVGRGSVMTSYTYTSDVLFISTVEPEESQLKHKDFATIRVNKTYCLPENTFTFVVGIENSSITSFYLDAYLWTVDQVSYVKITDGTHNIYDTVSDPVHVTYDISNFEYSNGIITICVVNTDGDPIEIDYMNVIAVFNKNESVLDNLAPTASNGSPTGTINDDTPLLGVMTDENALCKGTIDKDETYDQMDFTFSGTALTHSYQVQTPLALGSHTVYVRCKDYYDNVMQNSYSWSFDIQT
ncbi:MAG: hypothetical protein J7K68_00615 [Candidatus Diapherotrites archaeon]|nr:hypothetical protein [Candidatus Diapherotrites archaeon]